ncbi:hypothetical protein NE865_16461 [Phthorimaea operculella]|nr:hypothetical protein NE865_16461 [Phthorimaea operculella]
MGEFEIRLKNATVAGEYADFKNLVWQALTQISAQTNLLSLGLEHNKAFLRRKVLLFYVVAETKDERLAEVIAKVIGDKMQLSDITSSNLQACHRLGLLLVRFRDLDKRRSLGFEDGTQEHRNGHIGVLDQVSTRPLCCGTKVLRRTGEISCFTISHHT